MRLSLKGEVYQGNLGRRKTFSSVYGSRVLSPASEIVRTIPSALSNLKDENLKLLEPSDGKNCGVKTNLLVQSGFMGKSLSTREHQGANEE